MNAYLIFPIALILLNNQLAYLETRVANINNIIKEMLNISIAHNNYPTQMYKIYKVSNYLNVPHSNEYYGLRNDGRIILYFNNNINALEEFLNDENYYLGVDIAASDIANIFMRYVQYENAAIINNIDEIPIGEGDVGKNNDDILADVNLAILYKDRLFPPKLIRHNNMIKVIFWSWSNLSGNLAEWILNIITDDGHHIISCNRGLISSNYGEMWKLGYDPYLSTIKSDVINHYKWKDDQFNIYRYQCKLRFNNHIIYRLEDMRIIPNRYEYLGLNIHNGDIIYFSNNIKGFEILYNGEKYMIGKNITADELSYLFMQFVKPDKAIIIYSAEDIKYRSPGIDINEEEEKRDKYIIDKYNNIIKPPSVASQK